MARTLTAKQIESIKQSIAAFTGRFDFDVTMEEVWGEVDRVRHEGRPHHKGGLKPVSWQTAASMAQDDWGVYNMFIADKRGFTKGNSFLTFSC